MFKKQSIFYKFIFFILKFFFLLLFCYFLFYKTTSYFIEYFFYININNIEISSFLKTLSLTIVKKKNIFNYFFLEILLFFFGLFYIKKIIQLLKRGINEIIISNFIKKIFIQHSFIIMFCFFNPFLYYNINEIILNFFFLNTYIIIIKFVFCFFYFLIFFFLLQYVLRFHIFLKLEFFILYHYILFFSCLLFHINNFLLLLILLETIFFCLIFLFTGIFFRSNLNFNNLVKKDIYIKKELENFNAYSINLKNLYFFQKNFFSINGTINYFLYNAFALGLFLLSISFFFIFSPELFFFDFFFYLRTLWINSANILESTDNFKLNKNLFLFFVFFFFCFFFFKIGLFPFHTWIIKIIMSLNYFSLLILFIPYKIIIYFFFIYFYYNINMYLNIQIFLIILAALTIIIGSIGIIIQYNIRKFLAYSTITHTGYLTSLIACGNEKSFYDTLFYLLIYLITLYSFFLIVSFSKNKRDNKAVISFLEFGNAANLKIGIWKYLIIILFSFLGIPPLAGFWVKLTVIENLLLINSLSSWFLILIIILTTGLSTIGYLRIIKIFFIESSNIQKKNQIGLYPSFINYQLFICVAILFMYPLFLFFFKMFGYDCNFYLLILVGN